MAVNNNNLGNLSPWELINTTSGGSISGAPPGTPGETGGLYGYTPEPGGRAEGAPDLGFGSYAPPSPFSPSSLMRRTSIASPVKDNTSPFGGPGGPIGWGGQRIYPGEGQGVAPDSDPYGQHGVGPDGGQSGGHTGTTGIISANTLNIVDPPVTPDVYGTANIATSQQDLGISSGAVGSRKELSGMLQSYLGRSSLIQGAQRQKAIFTIDRFDGGINLNKAPRDLAYWEACQMDCLSPAKVGRIIRLGDFSDNTTLNMGLDTATVENYGLHYFRFSNEKDLGSSGTPTNYIAMQDGNDINIWDLSDGTLKADVITSLQDTSKPVYHSASNRVYVSDASFNASVTNSYLFGIVDRRKLFPYTDGTTVSYNKTGNSVFFTNKNLYFDSPTAGVGNQHICVSGSSTGLTYSDGGTGGIYINAQFADITGDETSSIGWGGSAASEAKYYKIYASFLYDEGSETKLADVTSTDNSTFGGTQKLTATTDSDGNYQKMVIKQVKIDGEQLFDNSPRINGARFYYTEVDGSANIIGNDKYLFAELDFRYGFKLMSEFGNWHLFEDDTSSLTAIQVDNAAETSGNTTPDGTLVLPSPPNAFTYYSLNLFHQEELKSDLLWKTSTMGNGIAFIGNVKYDGREYPDTMLYSGAGETDAGSAYPMWGTFPVDSNRIDIPGGGGEITALQWVSNTVLQFRKNILYVVDVSDVLAPRVVRSYQGMGVHGQWAVTSTPYGVAWVNDTGAYAYNAEEGRARSLTIGRIDTEDFQANSPHANTKIGYDDRSKMLIITNTTKYDTDGYHYAYSFTTDAWCTWNANKAHASDVKSNFAIDHDGYLTGAVRSSGNLLVSKWLTQAQAHQTVDYITKDFDFGKPNLDKRFYTLYISYTGGANQENMFVYFRVNGMKGTELTEGWTHLQTIQDYTDPYGDSGSTAWDGSSGNPTTGDPVVGTDPHLDSQDQVHTIVGKYEQKLAKINLRHLVASSGNLDDTVVDFTSDRDRSALPQDYLKFARSIQFRITGIAATTFEINDISLVFKEKRIK